MVGDDEYIVSRVIPTDGRSRAYVNGRLATAATLAELGARTVDLHGQHAHQSLLVDCGTARGARSLLRALTSSRLRAARARLTEIDASLAALGGDQRSRAREIDLLRFQVGELASAAITSADEDEQLTAEEDALADAAAHRAGRAAGRGSTGRRRRRCRRRRCRDGIGAAIRALRGRAPFDEFSARLHALAAELSDVGHELRAFTESLEEDPAAPRRDPRASTAACATCGASTATRWPTSSASAARRKSGSPSWRATTSASPRSSSSALAAVDRRARCGAGRGRGSSLRVRRRLAAAVRRCRAHPGDAARRRSRSRSATKRPVTT